MQAMPNDVVTALVADELPRQPMSALAALGVWLGLSALGWGAIAAVVASLI